MAGVIRKLNFTKFCENIAAFVRNIVRNALTVFIVSVFRGYDQLLPRLC